MNSSREVDRAYFNFFIYLTTEIRDFERSEEIPLQLMVRYFLRVLIVGVSFY